MRLQFIIYYDPRAKCGNVPFVLLFILVVLFLCLFDDFGLAFGIFWLAEDSECVCDKFVGEIDWPLGSSGARRIFLLGIGFKSSSSDDEYDTSRGNSFLFVWGLLSLSNS